MAKIYCAITESNRNTWSTALANKAGTVSVKNWDFECEARMVDHGGGERDSLTIVLRNIHTGESVHLVESDIKDLWAKARKDRP